MKTSIVLFGFLGLLAGCTSVPSEPAPSPTQTATAPGVRTIGPDARNVAPQALFARAGVTAGRPVVQVSTPLNPVDLLGQGYLPEESTHTDGLMFAAKGGAREYKVPIDTTDGDAYLFLGPQVEGHDAIEAALRDLEVIDPAGVRVNQRVSKGAQNADSTLPMSGIPLAGHPVGVYTVRFKSGSPKVGVAIETRLLASNIVMKLKPSTTEHLLGNQSFVDATLMEAGRPITGASVVADLVDGETIGKVAPIVFTEVGGGVYRAALHSVLTGGNKTGAYLTDVTATGTSPSGLAFARHGQAGFHYGIATARVVGISDHRTLTDASGLVSAFEVDVNLESRSYDRLEVSAKLTVVGADGQEHPIAIAHVGSGLEAGTHAVTLHFDAGHVRLTGTEGTFYVRDLQVYSLGTDTLFHRDIGSGNRFFPNVARASLQKLTALTPAQEQLVTEGVFFKD